MRQVLGGNAAAGVLNGDAEPAVLRFKPGAFCWPPAGVWARLLASRFPMAHSNSSRFTRACTSEAIRTEKATPVSAACALKNSPIFRSSWPLVGQFAVHLGAIGVLDAGDQEQPFGETGQAFAFLQGRGEGLAVFLRGPCAAQDDFNFAAEVVDRRAQFVSDMRREL